MTDSLLLVIPDSVPGSVVAEPITTFPALPIAVIPAPVLLVIPDPACPECTERVPGSAYTSLITDTFLHLLRKNRGLIWQKTKKN